MRSLILLPLFVILFATGCPGPEEPSAEPKKKPVPAPKPAISLPEEAVKGGASIKRFDLPDSLKWMAKEKIRSTFGLRLNEKMAANLKKAGFNVVHVNFEGTDTSSLEERAEITDRYGLHLMAGFHFQRNFPKDRRFVREDGSEHRIGYCPASEYHWQKLLIEPGLALAALKQKHPSVLGMVLDVEFYGSGKTGENWSANYCHCDACFTAFLKSKNLSPDPKKTARKVRNRWLREQKLYDEYVAFNLQRVTGVVAAARRKIQAKSPDFVFGVVLYGLSLYKDAMLRGLGTEQVPALSQPEFSYYTGYTRAIPFLEERFMRLKIPAVLIPGLWFVEETRPEQIVAELYNTAANASGYWVYSGTEWGGPSFNHIMREEPYTDRKNQNRLYDRPKDWIEAYRRANELVDKKMAAPDDFVAPPDVRIDLDALMANYPADLLKAYRAGFSDNYVVRKANCARLPGPIRIDGKIDEAFWKTAPAADGFHILNMGGLVRRRTVVRSGYDDEALYFGIRCEEPHPEKLAGEFKKDLYTQEVFELFLRVDEDSFKYYHFAVGPSGKSDDEYFDGSGRNWNGEWTRKTHIGKDAWTAEIRIPFKTIGIEPPKPGGRIWVNFARQASVPLYTEVGLWSYQEPLLYLHYPRQLGRLIFRASESK